MISAGCFAIETEPSLGRLAHEHLVPELQLVELRREFAFRNQFKEKFDLALIRRRHNRVGTFGTFVGTLHAQRRVLARLEFKFAARIDADTPKVRSDIDALGNFRVIELVVGGGHTMSPRCLGSLASNRRKTASWRPGLAMLVQ